MAWIFLLYLIIGLLAINYLSLIEDWIGCRKITLIIKHPLNNCYMKKILFGLMAALCLAAACPAFAQDAYTAEMNKMLEATQAKKQMMQTMATGWKSMNLPITDYDAAAAAVADAMWADLVNDYVVEYKKFFTLDDMKNINAFYETPTGRKFGTANPVISQAVMEIVGSKYTMTIQQALMPFIRR